MVARSFGIGFVGWVFAVLIAAGITSIGLSLWYRTPVAVAWSAPGTVLLISFGDQLAVSDMVGAYLGVALALFLLAVAGVFQRLMTWVPVGVSNGMMAGILFGFGLNATVGMLTFIITASGISVAGIGSAFWGVVVGAAVYAITDRMQRLRAPVTNTQP